MKCVAVIPVYNEEKTIREVVERAAKVVDKVIVVDDRSSDNSAEEAREAGAHVIKIQKNKGKANALKEGFKLCSNYDIIVMLDGDLQHLPEEIPALVKCVESEGDLCIGSRFKKKCEMPLQNRFSNFVASTIISLLAGQKITDPQSGFRAIRGECLEKLNLNAERYAMEHIMTLEAASKKLVIREVPVSCVYGDEVSNINPASDTLKVIYYIVKFLLKKG